MFFFIKHSSSGNYTKIVSELKQYILNYFAIHFEKFPCIAGLIIRGTEVLDNEGDFFRGERLRFSWHSTGFECLDKFSVTTYPKVKVAESTGSSLSIGEIFEC